MLKPVQNYDQLQAEFTWEIPTYYNIGIDVCDKWAEREPNRLALIYVNDGVATEYSFEDLRRLSNRLANLLRQNGINRGDRVAILLPQAPETAFSHIAIHKLGAISIPLFTLFGPDALAYRLKDSTASAIITNASGAARIGELRSELPHLRDVFCIEGGVTGTKDLYASLKLQSDDFESEKTLADDPAILIYTSGTTGQPKGALHAHRVLLGHLPGVELSHNFFPQAGDRIWTPADWAWIGGLLDVLMPALHHGVPVVARRFEKFDAEAAFQLIQDYGIRNAFIPPTALKMMRAVAQPQPQPRWVLNMRSIASGGESLGNELLDWGERTFGLTINEFYGQTECNMLISSCAALEPVRPGCIGRDVPGHTIAILDDQGRVQPVGDAGCIAIQRADPVMFLRYWNNPEATDEKFLGDWLLTGDTGIRESDGRISFVGRDDDLITSAGYRIGPGEIEDCLLTHPHVRMAAVVGKPDAQRTEIVKAYVVLQQDVPGTAATACELQEWVKNRLAAHEYPREVQFLDELPMTTTGKIIRRELRARAMREI